MEVFTMRTRVIPKQTGVLMIVLTAIAAAGYTEEAVLTPREKLLLERVEQLEKRVNDLEQQVVRPASESSPYVAPAATAGVSGDSGSATSLEADLTKRVEKVEKALEEKPAEDPSRLKVCWKSGLNFETEDKKFKLQIGGRIQVDSAWFNASRQLERALGEEDDGAEFRRARIDLRGTVYENVYYRMEFDFAGDADAEGRAKFTDVYLGLQGIPYVGRIQVGHFREPFGLEQQTNPNYGFFMENALPDVFTPKRNLGIMAYNAHLDQRLLWMIGAFKETDDFPSDDDSDEDRGYAITARLAGLPYYAEEGRKLFQVGAAYSYRNLDGAALRYRTRPESHLAMNYLDTERYPGFRFAEARVDDMHLIGLESLLIFGPFALQGEYMHSIVETDFAGTQQFNGAYLEAGYFITGENRVYDRANGVLTRVKPKKNFKWGKGWGLGAWEIATRMSYVDLEDDPIHGGEEMNFTAGVNWHLNPNARITVNYVYGVIDQELFSGNVNILQTRFQIDF